jgi:MFS family permease
MDRSRITFAAVVAGYFLVMFAVSPVSVVMPSLAESFGLSVEQASWVMTAYLLPLTACLLPAGRLGDIVGHRRLFTIGLALIAAASLVSAVAPDYWILLVARVVQGIGAALISACALPIITAVTAEARRGRSIGLVTMSSSLGAMAGVGLAPLFVQFLNWRWAFVTAAVAGLVALVPASMMRRDAAPTKRVRLDWPGAVLLLLLLAVASLSLNHFHDGPETFQDGWRWHLPMHAVALALLVMFVIVERRVKEPLVQLGHLTNGLFTTAVSANGVLHMTMMFAVFSTPFFVQRGLGLGPVQVGALLVIMQASTTVMTLVGGWLLDRTRSRWLGPVSLAMVASGLTMLGVLGESLGYAGYFAVVLWMGTGSGSFMTTNNTQIMGSLDAEHRGFASGMLETTRQYGHTLGVAVAAIGLAGVIPSLAAEQAIAVRAGFSQAALIMSAIAWLGVALAAYPLYRSATSERESTVSGLPASAVSST